jgi:PAS domain S-box-containing protein
VTPHTDDAESSRIEVLARENEALRLELARTRGLLESGETRTSLLLEGAPLPYHSLDAEGCLQLVSQGWLDLFGYEREEVMGQAFVHFISPEHGEGFRRNWEDMQDTGRSLGFECIGVRKNGERFNLCIDGMAGRDQDGAIHRTHCLLRDISAQKASQAVLEQREGFYRAVFDSAAIPIAIARDLRLLYLNPCMARAMGYETRAELLGLTVSEFVAPHHRPQFVERAQRREQGLEASSQYEVDVVHRTGRLIHTHATVSTLQLPDGPATLGFFQDITEHKRVADSLRQSEARFRRLFDEVPAIAVQGYAQDRTVIYWNAASERLYGYSRDEALGRKLEELIIPPALRPQVVEHVRAWVEDGVPIPSGELELMRKDGSRVPVFSCHVMQTRTDSKSELYCLDVDLSELQAAKAELTRARDAAEAANKAKSEFLANMSHEIRTPMNGVLGMLQLLMSSDLKGEQLEFVELAFQSSRRLLDLLNDILDFSRIESGKLTLANAPLSPKELAESVLRVFALNAERRGLALSLNVDESAAEPLLGDEARLRQILFNLMGNAIKFTSQGGVHLEVWAQPEPSSPSGRRRVYFSVSDTGVGIPEDKISRVFERFTQSDSSFTRKYEGAGLGLAIVKRILELMGGHIVMDSEVSQGTNVTFHLPMQPANAGRIRSRSGPSAASHEPGPSLSILVAEDDRISQMYICQQLRVLGHQATIVANGAEALEAVRRHRFDCVLMDVQMPVLDGVEATKAIRALDAANDRPESHIIAMTAYALSGDREKFLAAGMNDYISKPVQIADLVRALEGTQARMAHADKR